MFLNARAPLLLHLPVLLGLSHLAACGAALPRGDTPDAVSGTSRFSDESYTGDDGTHRYKLYLPSGYDGARAVPLVVMLHGCTQDPDDFARGTRMNALAEGHGFVVAYPEQPAAANPQKCWNWYDPAHQARDRGEPALIAAITRAVMSEYRVDPRRVYVAGVSAGGAMATLVGVGYPELYAAVASHSGTEFRAANGVAGALAAMQNGGPAPAAQGEAAFRAMGERARPVPVIVFHGAADPVVRPVNAEQTVAQWKRTLELAGVTWGEVEEQGPGLPAGDPPARYDVARTRHLDNEGRVLIESWIVKDLGHAWSGGSPEGSYTDAASPDASREIVRFFLQHPARP